jgi:hypothetical protein
MRERMNINPTGANSADPQTGEKKEDEATWNFYFFSFLCVFLTFYSKNIYKF